MSKLIQQHSGRAVSPSNQFLRFNTGRQYSAAGQRIAAALLPNGDIAMVDIDRGLDYLIPAGAAEFSKPAIVWAYDRGDFNPLQDRALLEQLSALALSI